jgi:hypothetical protein
VLAIARTEIPYIPTAKEARRGRFLRLAWPHLLLAAVYLITLGYTLYTRLLHTPQAMIVLTAEAVWAMVGFATVAVVLASGGIIAAWQARSTPPGAAWDDVDVESIG